LGVDDVEEEFDKLADLGVVFTKEPTQTQAGKVAVLDDTCGNLIQLHQF
jgi:predicted enzyme related to lactoylglutathione lyase